MTSERVPEDWTMTSALDEAGRVAASETVLAFLRSPDDSRLESVPGWTPDHWAAARRAVEVHGVGPLLDAAFESHPGSALAPLRAFTSHTAALNRQRAALWRSELARAMRAAADAGVATVALKGAAIVLHGFDAAELRPTADIDLLVAADALDGAEPVWQSLGYELEGRSAHHRLYFLRRLGSVARYGLGEHPDNPLRLDVHTSLRKSMPIATVDATAAVWSATERSTANDDAHLPDIGPLLQHVAVHAGNDLLFGAARWLTLRDLVLVAAWCTPADWTALLDVARRQRAERGFYATLRMAERYVGPAAPPEVMHALEAGTPVVLCNHLEETPLSLMSHVANRRGAAAIGRMLRWTRPGWERMLSARRILLPSPSEWAGRLGPDEMRGRFWYLTRMAQQVSTVLRDSGRRSP